MKTLPNRRSSRKFNARGARAALLISTAIGVASIANGAQAQTVVIDQDADITYQADTVSGTPHAVYLESNQGKIDAQIGSVTATSVNGDNGDIVYMETELAPLNATIGSITATGSGDVYGFSGESDSGAINVHIGTLDLQGNSTVGVLIESNSGDITLSGDNIYTRGANYNPDSGMTGDGLTAITGGKAAITLGSGQSDSLYGSVAAAVGDAGATLTSTYAKTTGDMGAALVANSANGDTLLTSGTIETTAADSAAINTTAVAGNATVVSDTIAASGERGQGINAKGAAGVSVTSGTIDAGSYGINAVSANGDATVVTTGNTTARTTGSGIYASGQNVKITTAEGSTTAALGTTGTLYDAIDGRGAQSVTITNGGTALNQNGVATIYGVSSGGTVAIDSAVTSNQGGGSGIVGSGQTGVTIHAGTVNAGGQAIRAQSAAGEAAITTTGDITSRNANAISISAQGFSVTTGEGATVTSNGGTAAVAGLAQAGDASVVNQGTIAAKGPAESGIGVTASGNVTVDSNIITVEGTAVPSSGFNSGAVSAVSSGSGNVSVHSAQASVGGQGRFGIYASTSLDPTGVGGGTVTIDSGELTHASDNMAAIRAQSQQGAIDITSGTITNSGVSSVGIEARSAYGGDIAITSGTLVNSATGSSGATYDNGDEVIAEGIYANTAGKVSIDAGSTEVHGYGASAIVALAADDINVNSGTIATYGDDTTALYFGTYAGDITAVSDSLTTAGNFASGIAGGTDDGAVSVTSNTISTVGTSGYGISVSGTTGATVVSNTISATGTNAYGIYAATDGGAASVTSGDITAARFGVNAQSATGDTAITLNGNTITGSDFTSGTSYGARGVGGNVSITAAEDTTTSGVSYGIDALARDTATIDSAGLVTASGDRGTALHATAAGDISIVSSEVGVTGAGTDPGVDQNTGFRAAQGGIVADSSNGGAISIDSGTVNVAGDYRYGIFAHSDGAIDVASAQLDYAAFESAGIMIVGGAGDVTVDSGILTATGVSGAGVVARSTSGDITIAADQTHLTGEGYTGNYTADAVVGLSDTGAVKITSNDASTAGLAGSAVAAVGGSVTIDSTTAAASGNLGAIVYAFANTGDATVTSGTITSTGESTDALYAASQQGKVTIASGAISAMGDGSTGISGSGATGVSIKSGKVDASSYGVSATSSGGDAAVHVNGAVASSTGTGVIANGVNASVTVDAGASVSGVTGISTGGQTLSTIVNNGSISATSGPAIQSTAGTTHLTNAGTISGAQGAVAVSLGGADDSVTLKTGSAVVGAIDTGAGLDTVTLEGTLASGSASQSVARFVNAEQLNVATGYWTANAPAGTFAQVSIATGATLQLDDTEDATIDTGNVVVNGTLAVNHTDAEVASADGVLFSGIGAIDLIGSGTVQIADGSGYQQAGGFNVRNGTLLLTGALDASVATSGAGVFALGNGATTGDFTGDLVNNGTFRFDRTDDYAFTGDFSGSGLLLKNGDGRLTFSGLYAFEGTTTINGGSVAFTGQLAPTTEIDLNQGTLDLSQVDGGQQTIGELSGSSQGTVALGGSTLGVNQSSNSTFAGTITGTGGLEKSGTGTLNLTGTNTYSGDTNVSGGTLKVNGALPNSTVQVNQGGTVGGNGTIGGLQTNGGTVAPGNSIGRLAVNGNVNFGTGSVYAVEVNPLGQSDRVDATGTATLSSGASVSVLAEAGRYAGRTDYTILTAAGGVTGKFGSVTSNFAFLTPSLGYTANAVTLTLTRNNVTFGGIGATANQRATGAAIQALGGGNPLFEEALYLSDTGALRGFQSLSGELHSGISSALVEDAQMLRHAMLDRTAPTTEGLYGWAGSLASWGGAGVTSATQQLDTSAVGAMGGIGYGAGSFDAAIGIGGTRSDYNLSGHADDTVRFVTGQARYAAGGFTATVGASYAWHDIETVRTATLGAINNRLTADYDAHTSQAYADIGYSVPVSAVGIGPFAGLSYVHSQTDRFTEAGGALALDVARETRDATFSTLGVRLGGWGAASDEALSILPTAKVAWRHGWGDLQQSSSVALSASPSRYGIAGPMLSKDAAELGVGLEAHSGPWTATIGYSGMISEGWDNHSARASVAFRF